tara:strand:- start:159 stop:392 length:234 start_codon:yes stop_codon:yes gene_type:complete
MAFKMSGFSAFTKTGEKKTSPPSDEMAIEIKKMEKMLLDHKDAMTEEEYQELRARKIAEIRKKYMMRNKPFEGPGVA